MKVIITDQALNSNNSAFDFLYEQGVPVATINLISKKIFDRIDRLIQALFIGKKESFMTSPEKRIQTTC